MGFGLIYLGYLCLIAFFINFFVFVFLGKFYFFEIFTTFSFVLLILVFLDSSGFSLICFSFIINAFSAIFLLVDSIASSALLYFFPGTTFSFSSSAFLIFYYSVSFSSWGAAASSAFYYFSLSSCSAIVFSASLMSSEYAFIVDVS